MGLLISSSLPIPKPTKTKRCPHDPASFREEDLLSVYPDWRCILTKQSCRGYSLQLPMEFRIIDPHHILGRHRGDPIYSSVYNCAPLIRLLHNQTALVQDSTFTLLLLQLAKRAVDRAVELGLYRLRDEDLRFLEISREQRLREQRLREQRQQEQRQREQRRLEQRHFQH